MPESFLEQLRRASQNQGGPANLPADALPRADQQRNQDFDRLPRRVLPPGGRRPMSVEATPEEAASAVDISGPATPPADPVAALGPDAGPAGGEMSPFDQQLLDASMAAAAGGGGGGPRQTETLTRTVPVPLGPEGQDAAQEASEAFAEQQAIREDQRDTAAAAEQRVSDVLGGMREDLARQHSEEQDIRNQFRTRFKEQVQRYDQELEEVRNLRVDPDRFFAQRGTGTRILAGLAAALGSIGSALSGGPNTAVSLINRAIDRDIDAQKANIMQRTRGVQAKGNMLNRMRQIFEDDLVAQHAAKAALLERAKLQVQQIQQQTRSETVRNNADLIIEEMDRQQAAARVQVAQAAAGTVETQIRRRRGGGPNAAQRRLRGLETFANLRKKLKDSGMIQDGDSEEIQSGIQKISERFTAQKIPEIQGALAEVENQLESGLTAATQAGRAVRDVPLARLLSADQTRILDNNLMTAITLMAFKRSGAAVPEPEFIRFWRAAGLRVDATENELQNGVNAMRRELDRSMENIFQGAPPAAVRTFLQRGPSARRVVSSLRDQAQQRATAVGGMQEE